MNFELAEVKKYLENRFQKEVDVEEVKQLTGKATGTEALKQFGYGRPFLVSCRVDYLFPIYREANSYPHLLEQGITGNPESLKAEELHGQAWGIVEPQFLKAQEEAMAKYKQLAGSARASKDLKKIVPAACEGRIDILWVTVGVQQWGFFDPDKCTIHIHAEPEFGDEDLLDFAAVHTILNGVTVYAMKPEEMPDEAPLAAVFRY